MSSIQKMTKAQLIEKVKSLQANTDDITVREKVGQVLLENKERLEKIIKNTSTGYFFIDKDGIIKDVNDAWIKLYKYDSKDEIINHHFAEIQKIEDLDLAKTFVREIMNNNPDYLVGEFSRKCKDDSIGYHSFSANPVYTQNELVGIEGFIFDITERKHAEKALEESEEKYRLLFENILDSFALHEIVLDNDGKPIDYIFVEVNHAFELDTGLKGSDILGKKVTEVIPGIEKDPADWINQYGKVALTGKEIRFEQYAESLNQWYSVLAFSPKKNYFATIFKNITETKMSEKELEKYRDHLEELVQARTVELESKNDELERMNQLFVGREFRIKELKDKLKNLSK